MKNRRIAVGTTLAAVVTLLGITGTAVASSNIYNFGVSDQRSNVTFESETDFEIILGSWLDAEKYPAISFASKEAERISGNRELTTTVDAWHIPQALSKKVSLKQGELIKVPTSFPVKLLSRFRHMVSTLGLVPMHTSGKGAKSK